MARLLWACFAASALFAQSHWPAQLERDVQTQSWEAAGRVGAALIAEIEAGRIFAGSDEIGEEIKARQLYAEALDHLGKIEPARAQRAIAATLATRPEEIPRRLLRFKAEIAAAEINEPAVFPASDKASIVVFWASWCAACKPELDQLSRYKNPLASVRLIDVDQLDPAARRRYLRLESLEGAELPQLLVVDRKGSVRFRTVGFDNAALFAKKLDWMVEAALQ